MKKIIVSIFLCLLIIALGVIFFYPLCITKKDDGKIIKIKAEVPNGLEYFIINNDGTEEKVVLMGNTPEKKLSNFFFISNKHTVFGINGEINNIEIARNKITGEKLRIVNVKNWFIVAPSENITLFDYYLPWEKKKDYVSYYDILRK